MRSAFLFRTLCEMNALHFVHSFRHYMEPLKEMFNLAFYEDFAGVFQKHYKEFPKKDFLKEVTHNLSALSLNERLRKTSVVLKKHLPPDYLSALAILIEVIPYTKRGYTNLVFPDFVGLYGHHNQKQSLEALKYFTQFGSSEFAIREFLKRDFEYTIKTMQQWSKDENEHVRRLASEGSRPRLPWSFKLDAVIQNPQSTQIILENLKADNSLYVRKSVANHLNDFSKDHPEYMLDLVGAWNQNHPHTAWIVKHASRTLIKKGHPKALQLFQFEKKVQVELRNFKLNKSVLKLGDTLKFSLDIVSKKNSTQKLVIDYIIHYRKKSGELSPKVFKLKEINLKAKEIQSLSKSQLIKDFTTRKHETGEHVIEIQVNGKVLEKQKFLLKI